MKKTTNATTPATIEETKKARLTAKDVREELVLLKTAYENDIKLLKEENARLKNAINDLIPVWDEIKELKKNKATVASVKNLGIKLDKLSNTSNADTPVEQPKTSKTTTAKKNEQPKEVIEQPKEQHQDNKKNTTEYGDPILLINGKFMVYRNSNGSIIKHNGIKAVLKSRIKAQGGKWNSEQRAWEFNTAKACKDAVKKIDTHVTEAQIKNELSNFSNKAEKDGWIVAK